MEINLQNKIKGLRLKLNMSQERFGKKFGVSGKTVSAYERGKCNPPVRVLERISHTYDTSFIAIDVSKRDALACKINLLRDVISELEDKLLN